MSEMIEVEVTEDLKAVIVRFLDTILDEKVDETSYELFDEVREAEEMEQIAVGFGMCIINAFILSCIDQGIQSLELEDDGWASLQEL